MTARPELEARLAASTPAHTVRGVIISSLLAHVGQQVGEAARARVAAQLSSPRFTDFFAYPVADLNRATDAGARELGGDWSAAAWRLGASLAEPFFTQTPAGKLAVSLLGGNMRRLCSGLPAAYGMVANFGQRSVTFPEARAGVFSARNDFVFPELHGGAIEAAARLLGGAPQARVSLRPLGLLDCDFDIRW